VREAAGDAERTPPDARACTGRRSVEVRLDVGRVSFDLENDVCGEEETWEKEGGVRIRGGRSGMRVFCEPVGYIGNISYLANSCSRLSLAS
jgi:hypothetical protein